jgi:hypothetical protein
MSILGLYALHTYSRQPLTSRSQVNSISTSFDVKSTRELVVRAAALLSLSQFLLVSRPFGVDFTSDNAVRAESPNVTLLAEVNSDPTLDNSNHASNHRWYDMVHSSCVVLEFLLDLWMSAEVR